MAFADRLPLKLPRFLSPALPRIDGGRNLVRDLWNVLSGMPGGPAMYARPGAASERAGRAQRHDVS
jgi:hypothetical protein